MNQVIIYFFTIRCGIGAIYSLVVMKQEHAYAQAYLRFGNFCEKFIFVDCIKNISDVKNSRLRQDLPIPINDRVILRGFYVSRK